MHCARCDDAELQGDLRFGRQRGAYRRRTQWCVVKYTAKFRRCDLDRSSHRAAGTRTCGAILATAIAATSSLKAGHAIAHVEVYSSLPSSAGGYGYRHTVGGAASLSAGLRVLGYPIRSRSDRRRHPCALPEGAERPVLSSNLCKDSAAVGPDDRRGVGFWLCIGSFHLAAAAVARAVRQPRGISAAGEHRGQLLRESVS